MELAVVISIVSCVVAVSGFALSRKDKAVKDTKETAKEHTNQELIDYRLTQVEKKLDKILDILDNYDVEIDERIQKAMNDHLRIYHGEKWWE